VKVKTSIGAGNDVAINPFFVFRAVFGNIIEMFYEASVIKAIAENRAHIGSATTARFALLPTPNPSGNFTKITQRMPVKIDMVEMPKPLTPGMMVEVEIDLR
jgi:membrane fusion protein (multidrug efflux system)